MSQTPFCTDPNVIPFFLDFSLKYKRSIGEELSYQVKYIILNPNSEYEKVPSSDLQILTKDNFENILVNYMKQLAFWSVFESSHTMTQFERASSYIAACVRTFLFKELENTFDFEKISSINITPENFNKIKNQKRQKYHEVVKHLTCRQQLPETENELMDFHKLISQLYEANPKLKEIMKKEIIEHNTLKNKNKIFCTVCGDTESDIQIVEIKNSSEKNNYLCVECMESQKKLYNVKFSDIEDGVSYML